MKSGPRISRCHRSARKGISLVELLIVMSAATVILTISAALVHRIMHAHAKARAFINVERISLRLANAFRSDVHQAISATTSDAAQDERAFLRLELPGGQQLEYRREGGTILRILFDGERTASREAFAFPAGIELASRKDGSGLIVLSITSSPGEMPSADGASQPNSYAVPVNLHVEAALNRDQRFTAAAPGQRGGS